MVVTNKLTAQRRPNKMTEAFFASVDRFDTIIRSARNYPLDCVSLPLPGHVGKNYPAKRVLFIGQSPGQAGQRRSDGYWAGEHHFNEDMTVTTLRAHYYAGLIRCNIGEFLKFLMDDTGVSFDDIAFTNVVKNAIANNDVPINETIKFWTPYLHKQLNILRPKLIVCLGRLASDFFDKNADFFHVIPQRLLFSLMVRSIILALPHPSYIKRSRNERHMTKRAKLSFVNALKEAKV